MTPTSNHKHPPPLHGPSLEKGSEQNVFALSALSVGSSNVRNSCGPSTAPRLRKRGDFSDSGIQFRLFEALGPAVWGPVLVGKQTEWETSAHSVRVMSSKIKHLVLTCLVRDVVDPETLIFDEKQKKKFYHLTDNLHHPVKTVSWFFRAFRNYGFGEFRHCLFLDYNH
ncbi:hypothetical protein AVEN_226152-1 [Araneus ventricosus]|uniref:Uncharacterized protein n=1 Tax=Araneus ventricosus TaxID=182803 RepID=A0A4Y2TPU6_ARAVE|nr:hypothetical protein AVEN_226152-1 [Araneus ventricosus]